MDPGKETEIFTPINVAYHMNHRNKKRQILYDETRSEGKRILERFGNTRVIKYFNPKEVIINCRTPYACDFDIGILYSVGRNLSKNTTVEDIPNTHCRKDGKSDLCTYIVRL